MFKDNKFLALIPARGGSKGIKDKNITSLNGKPLIAYTIEAARNCPYIDDVVVTTDSSKIADVAAKYGARIPFLRPASLASDNSTTLDAILHAVTTLKSQGNEYDYLVLLQPTSPLRTSNDITKCIDKMFEYNSDNIVSISPVNDNPVLIRQIADNGHVSKLLNQSSTVRRQDMKPYYRVNGSIYINKISDLNEKTSFNDNECGYIMDSSHSVDIDEYTDILYAEAVLSYTSRNTL